MNTMIQPRLKQRLIARRRHAALKRVFDTALIVATSPATIPAAALTALLVRVNLGKPILFRQQRVGLGEETFELLKFRSMLPETDSQGRDLAEGARLTKFGRLLRASSMDELPQLLNVLRGEMSLVGPRPLLVEYLPYYNETERARHSVRPGITGAAQIGGRNNLDWDGRLTLDARYAQKAMFLDDIKILWRTLDNVARRKDTVAESWDHFEDFNHYRSYPSDGKYALRRIEPRDAETCMRLFKQEHLSEFMGIGTYGTEDVTAWLKAARLDPLRKNLVVYELENRRVAAVVGYQAEFPGARPLIYIAAEVQVESTALSLILKFIKQQDRVNGAEVELPPEQDRLTQVCRSQGFEVVGATALEDRVKMEIRW